MPARTNGRLDGLSLGGTASVSRQRGRRRREQTRRAPRCRACRSSVPVPWVRVGGSAFCSCQVVLSPGRNTMEAPIQQLHPRGNSAERGRTDAVCPMPLPAGYMIRYLPHTSWSCNSVAPGATSPAQSQQLQLVQRQRVAHLALTLTRRYCLSFPSRSAVGPLTTLRRHYCLGISISGRRCGPAPKPSKPSSSTSYVSALCCSGISKRR